MLLTLIFLHCIANTAVIAVRVGIIPNVSLVISDSTETMTAATCDECLCAMFSTGGNASVSALNCHVSLTTRTTCQIFTADTYRTSSILRMDRNRSSTFFFRQLPTNNGADTTVMTTGTHTSALHYVMERRMFLSIFSRYISDNVPSSD